MKIHRTKLSFDKDDIQRASLKLHNSGISLKPPVNTEETKKMHESFGIFGGSNNSNIFIPNLDVKNDLTPKPEDFVDAPFRLLSATVVGGGSWKATDFSDVKALKESVKQLEGKPVYYDHDTDLLNWVGIVKAPKWAEAYTDSKGNKVPAGIDGIIAIDGKTNPKIARGVLIRSIFSNSVTVEFDWVRSHPKMEDNEFYNKIGTYDADGKMVTRKVTKIYDYHESSLVWLGADPFAKMQDKNGDLINIDRGSVVEYAKEKQDVKELYEKSKKYFISTCLNKADAISLAKEYTYSAQPDDNKPNTNDMEILALIAAHFGIKVEDITAENIKTWSFLKAGQVSVEEAELNALKLNAAKAHEAEIAKADLATEKSKIVALEKEKNDLATEKVLLVAEKDNLTAEKTALAKEVEELKPVAEVGTKYIQMTRDEVKRLYALAVDNKTEPSVVALFDSAKPEQLEGLLAQYTKGAKVKFNAKCQDCQSDNVSFKSTLTPSKDEPKEEKLETSFDEIYQKYNKGSMIISK